MKRTFSFLICILFFGCISKNDNSKNDAYLKLADKELCDYVRPLIGTHGEGNTFPGAVAPFGMLQISPDTDTEDWGSAAGYEYSDSSMLGFSLTHFNGTGIPDLGDFLFVPSVGKIKFQPGKKDGSTAGYRTRFSHNDETASPGYYSVILPEHNIKVELASAERAGMLQFTFPQTDSANIMIDLHHVLHWKIIWSSVRIVNDSVVTGYHQVKGWAKERLVYFAAIFSKKFDDCGIIKNGEPVIYNTRRFRSRFESCDTNLQVFARYKTIMNEAIRVKVGISAISADNAMKNLKAEIPGWGFHKVVQQTRDKWNKELQCIEIDASEADMETFYTALYHAFLTPALYEDIDGNYMGLDKTVHESQGFTNYAIFSLWDTYRAVHPLFNLIQAERNADMINSMLAHYDQSTDHLLPVWSLNSNETWCMIGYHAVPVIADAYLKGVKGFDVLRAYNAIKTTAMNPDYDNVMMYAEIGYVPFDKENEAVSKTLEYAFDDYCIAEMAKALGKDDDYKYFIKRAMAYKNIFDTSVGYMRGKDSKGNWREKFTPDFFEQWGDFTEGTSRQYTWYVPHDIKGLINIMGKDKFNTKLDSLFITNINIKRDGVDDIQGRIGEYWHGNEPSHHIAFLYNYIGKPWKTQELVHKIINTQYGNKPNSLCGNDDCGQMSAWYIFNIMGFYPVCPASDYYVIGSPCVAKAVMHLSNGKDLTIKADNYSNMNIYIQSVFLNGKKWNNTYIPFEEIKNGGEIQFIMGSKPNMKWGTMSENAPPSFSN
ncbi:MAG: glycoside hydrolase family 92 protein [Bacteroidia bacterium]|nr:glycoside hydrolase family 92 protein [Bacteroidia bacterium]